MKWSKAKATPGRRLALVHHEIGSGQDGAVDATHAGFMDGHQPQQVGSGPEAFFEYVLTGAVMNPDVASAAALHDLLARVGAPGETRVPASRVMFIQVLGVDAR